MPDSSLHALIAELEQLRQSRVILYVGQDRGQHPHLISGDDVLPLYQCLRRSERVDRLDLVLHTTGGKLVSAHRLWQLLRAYGDHLSVLVPFQARSAGTLLCLGAHEIVMGPLAELSPIDPQIVQQGAASASMPPMLAAEDIRLFPHMARAWFGIDDPSHHLQLLQLLCERIFPPSLTAFFRAAQQVEAMTEQHLRVQLPGTSPERRQEIARYFLQDGYSHDLTITREDAIQLGLAVAAPSPQEEALLWRIWERCYQQMLSPASLLLPPEASQQVMALIASKEVLARCLVDVITVAGERQATEPEHAAHLLIEHHWEVTDASPA